MLLAHGVLQISFEQIFTRRFRSWKGACLALTIHKLPDYDVFVVLFCAATKQVPTDVVELSFPRSAIRENEHNSSVFLFGRLGPVQMPGASRPTISALSRPLVKKYAYSSEVLSLARSLELVHSSSLAFANPIPRKIVFFCLALPDRLPASLSSDLRIILIVQRRSVIRYSEPLRFQKVLVLS